MTNVRQINEACIEAAYGRGASVMGIIDADNCKKVTRARTVRGVLQGRKLNGDWIVIVDAQYW